ncbi:hypothetical protein BTJ45_01928 [Bacillus mycoides]|nr:hypothetical protein BTJ45_01928 [Bacillus mycoides]
MKLRPWRFKYNEVMLKWLGNATLKKNTWLIRAGVEYNNQIEILEFPIAALPLLKIGAKYKDGQILEHLVDGIIYDVTIPTLDQYKVVTALEACKKVDYYLFANKELMNQSVFEFSVEGKTYYFPQAEFIRAVFAINKIISNAMVRPNGIEFLVTYARLNGQRAFLELADDIPNNIVKDDGFIRYIGWLYFSKILKSSFESIYTLLNQKLMNNQQLKLEVSLPSVLDTFVRFRGINKGNNYLMLEWLGSDMAGTTFTDIEVKHKAFKKLVGAQGKRKYRKSIKENDGEKVLNEDLEKRSKQDADQQVVDMPSTQLQFENIPNVHKVYGAEQQVNQGEIYFSNQGQGGGIQQEQVVGFDESIYGGTIQPIDFKTLEVTNDIRGQDLEKFIKMIRVFQSEYKKYSVALNFVYLPGGRTFSFLANGNRRLAAIGRITNQYMTVSSYLIEVSTIDGRSLSTLLIKNISDNMIENIIKELLKKLVYNSGSWNSDSLKHFDYIRVKHTKQNEKEWSRRIEKYL